MKILKRIVIVLLVIIAIPLIIALFVPKEFQSEREIVVDRPKNEVFDYIKYVKNQDHFGKWQLSDPGMTTTEEGVDGTVGFKYSWEGDKTGKGSQKITGIQENERLDTELDFGMGDPVKSYFITEDAGNNQTLVTWGVHGRTPYPWNLMSLLYDLGEDFEVGLQNLKVILER